MSASQTLHLVEKLTKAKIPKETAAELLEFVEQSQKGTVSKDYRDARFEGIEVSVNARFTGLRLFVAFNTALLIAVLVKLFVG